MSGIPTAIITGSMHYEKAPPLQKVAAVMGAASAPLRCAGASLRYGGARNNCKGESGAKGLQKDIEKSAREWHFDLKDKSQEVYALDFEVP